MSAFLDTSALAKLYHQEIGTDFVQTLLAFQSPGYISRLGLVELQSVLSRKIRTKTITRTNADLALLCFRSNVRHGQIIVTSLKAQDFDLAEALIGKYGDSNALRTLDSLQLSPALNLTSSRIIDTFITSDKAIAQVASMERLIVLNPETAQPADL